MQTYGIAAALVSLNIENERNINPVPLQAFADNIAVVQSKAEVIQKMFDVGESLMNRAGLEVKPSKCAVLCARRSGNHWYKGKYDKEPKVTVQNHKLSVHGRNTSYKYLGESLSLSGKIQSKFVKSSKITKTYLVKFPSATFH